MKKQVIQNSNIQNNTSVAITNNKNNIRLFGVFNDKLVEQIPNFLKAPCEVVWQGENNTFITFGRDRPSDFKSGYGGLGHTQAGTIDIVAGRMSANIKTETISPDIKTIIPLYADNNFIKDASRIYVSQKTDVDKNFKVKSKYDTNGKAAVAIKSDNVRLIARETMKLVTGTDVKNSRGADIASMFGIELIAGNDEDSLQPMVRGQNLLECIRRLSAHVDALNAIIDQFVTYQLELNSVLMSHVHPDPMAMYFGMLSSGNPLEITNGCTLPSPEVVETAMKINASILLQTKKDIIANKTNLANFSLNFLEPFGEKYINSRYNKVN